MTNFYLRYPRLAILYRIEAIIGLVWKMIVLLAIVGYVWVMKKIGRMA